MQVVHWRAVQILRLHLAAWQLAAELKRRSRAQATAALVWYAQQLQRRSLLALQVCMRRHSILSGQQHLCKCPTTR